jgi:hypothetical protein
MNPARHSFGSRLKAERERRGIALKSIAASTKIKESLFADLERGDVSKWPDGIFRRSFVREYAASIGLSPEPVVAEFLRVFAEHPAGGTAGVTPETAPELRLTIANGGRAPVGSLLSRAAAALLEACALLGLVQVVTWLTGFNFWVVCATTSMAYYGVAAAYWDRTPVSRWLQRERPPVAAAADAPHGASQGVLGLLVGRARLESYTPGAAADTVDVVTGS